MKKVKAKDRGERIEKTEVNTIYRKLKNQEKDKNRR